jgi:hypothetical protein
MYTENLKGKLFFMKHKYKKGTYRLLQSEPLWIVAKMKLLHNEREKNNGDVFCWYCKDKINGLPVMHHRKYNFNKIFDNIVFVHYKCHNKIHIIKKNWRKRRKKK